MANSREVAIAAKKSRKWATVGPSWGIYESLKQTLENYRKELLQPIDDILQKNGDPQAKVFAIHDYLQKIKGK